MVTARAARVSGRAVRVGIGAALGEVDRAVDGLLWLRARRLFQSSGLFAGLPLTGRVLEVEGGRGHLAEAAVHHIPNRRCVVVDSGHRRRQRVDRRVRRRKFHRVCASPERLPFAEASFDAAWTSFALGRLTPAAQKTVLAEVVRVVRPGGVLIALERVSGVAHDEMSARFGELFTLSGLLGKQSYWPVERWRRLLLGSGWQIEVERGIAGRFGLPACRTFVCRRPWAR